MPINLDSNKLIQAINRVEEKPNLPEMKLDLKLNLSPPRIESPSPSTTASPASPYVSSEDSLSPEAISMMLVGCPKCLVYLMLAEEDPRCPKCKSTVLLNVIHYNNCKTTVKKTSAKL